MINVVIKGKIVSRQLLTGGSDVFYSAFFVVEVQNWHAGEKMTQLVNVYAPKFMEKRLDFWMKEDTKFITVVGDHATAVTGTQPGNVRIAVVAQALHA